MIAIPRVIGHRGVAGHAPENTLAGFRLARAMGVRWVEFDVRLTADARCVLLHDNDLDRTTDGTGAVHDLPLDEIAACDAGSFFDPSFAGERVPTLEEALDLAAELELGINIELKPAADQSAALAGTVCAIVREQWPHGLPSPLISSFDPSALAAAQAAAPELPRAVLFDALVADWRDIATSVGAAAVHCAHTNLSRARANDVCEAGFPLLAYTVNHAGRCAELFDWGVSAVFSDVPDRLRAVAISGGNYI